MAIIPTGNADIAALGLRVANAWANHPSLTLSWITQADAVTLTTNYSNAILQASQTRGTGRNNLRAMWDLEKTINDNLFRLKQLIQIEYGKKQLRSHYADFGIIKEGSNYKLPTDRDKRLEALRLMTSSLATAPFQAHPYGEAYWQNILTQYIAEKTALEIQVGQVSLKVQDKIHLKKQVLELLRAMKLIVLANYRGDAKDILRTFGYLDERV